MADKENPIKDNASSKAQDTKTSSSEGMTGGKRYARRHTAKKHHKKHAKKHHKKSHKKHHKKSHKKHHKKSHKKHAKKHFCGHKKHHKRHHKKRGGSMVATAALPFGLLALQKFFQTRKDARTLRRHLRAYAKPHVRFHALFAKLCK